MTPRAKALAAHIDAICDANKIRIEYFDGGEFAWTDDRIIRIRPVRGDRSYASAMHEIGHILGKWQTRPQLVEETGAWLWAEKNAVCWTPTMRSLAANCLLAYFNARKASEFVPPRDHEFWRLVKNKGNT